MQRARGKESGVFSRKQHVSLSRRFQLVYILQLCAVVAIFIGMFLIWWEGVDRLTALDLLGRTTGDIERRNPQILGQPLIVLWLLWPSVVVSGLRSFTGILVAPVSYRWLAMIAWLAAMGAVAHFYISFGGEGTSSPLDEGHIQPGFWLTALATAALGVLLVVEGLIKPREVIRNPNDRAPAEVDAESLWRGEYITCPFCGALNRPNAKKCYNCRILLFDFDDEIRRRGS